MSQKKRGRKTSPKRPQDHFGKRAKREGKPARSYYKLEEMDEKFQLLKPGMSVLDLGCSPGAWLMYAYKKVGEKGRVIGYDLKPVEVALPAYAQARIGDVFEVNDFGVGSGFDVVLSDMAPATTGSRDVDGLRSATLVERALYLAEQNLKPGGHFVAKLLESGEIEGLMCSLRAKFTKVRRARPKATRRESTEVFLVAMGMKKLRVSDVSLKTDRNSSKCFDMEGLE